MLTMVHLKQMHGFNIVMKKGQTSTFADANAHHQNGVTERRVHSLQELSRTMTIHANKCWPKAMTANPWPHAVQCANKILNNAPTFSIKK